MVEVRGHRCRAPPVGMVGKERNRLRQPPGNGDWQHFLAWPGDDERSRAPSPLAGFRVGIAAHANSAEQIDVLRRAGAEPVPGAVVGPVPSGPVGALEAVTEDLLGRPPSVVVLTSAAGWRAG